MPSLSQLPGEIKRNKLAKALARLGFVLDEKGGNGSHYKITWPKNQKSVTLPYDLKKSTLYYVLKEIENISGVTWEDIQKEL
ncbi:MAG: type II toxin-antitoxin system HicA family toxin [Candidatus Spechtbacteria bacterium]|nr:type II toxin-antitoxin system HicA family toxin [Candidatus Spechtbacteria bacterium]